MNIKQLQRQSAHSKSNRNRCKLDGTTVQVQIQDKISYCPAALGRGATPYTVQYSDRWIVSGGQSMTPWGETCCVPGICELLPGLLQLTSCQRWPCPSASPLVGSECGSSTNLRRSSLPPHHNTTLVNSSSAGDLQDGGVGVEVGAENSTPAFSTPAFLTLSRFLLPRFQSAWRYRRVRLLGRPLCSGCVCGWSSSFTFCTAVSGALLLPRTRASTGQCSFFSVYGIRTWKLTTHGSSIAKTNALCIKAPPQDPPVPALN